MCGGGGGSSQPSQQTVTQVTIPPEIMPYAKKLLGTAEDLVYNQPYQSYEGQRFAGFNPLQMQAFGQIQNQQTASQLAKATDLATIAGNTASQSVYNPAAAQNFYQPMDTSFQTTTAPSLQQYQMAQPGDVVAERVAANYNYSPERAQGYQYGQLAMDPAERVRAERLEQYRMGPAALVSAEQFGPGSAAQYMSPYMQDVVERQKREAVQDYARGIPAIQAAGIRAGGRGGTREALIESEARRNLANQLGGIQATGLQSAYQQAMQQYNVDQAQRMQAGLANQAAIQDVARQNLQAAMGIQSLGAQTGLQAALANQQAGLTVGQQNLAAEQARQQFMGQQSLQAQLANQQAFQRSAEFGSSQQMQAALANQQAAMQAALANQQAGLTTGQQNLAANLGVQSLGANLGMQSQQLNQQAQLQAQQQALAQRQAQAQYGLAGANLAEQSRQFGANYGLSNIQQQLAAAGMLGNLGQTQFGQQQAINQSQMAAGSQAQQLEQARLQAAYEDFLNRQRYPYQQLGFMSDLIRGTPTAGNVQSFYGAQASPIGSVAGVAGMYLANQAR